MDMSQNFCLEYSLLAEDQMDLFQHLKGNDTPIAKKKPAIQSSILKKFESKDNRDMNERRVQWDPSTRDKPESSKFWRILSSLESIITPVAILVFTNYFFFGWG